MGQAFFGHFGVKMRGQKGSKWGPEPFLGVPRKRGIFGVFLGFWKYRVFGVFLGSLRVELIDDTMIGIGFFMNFIYFYDFFMIFMNFFMIFMIFMNFFLFLVKIVMIE